ncbi:hypothetical protein QLX08_000365 [Tetragonisca angustula]|uniref:Uncharacterized protein n=1 Tax=Tetragonisca angustula TaxID=166442 RepID=A0AAW1AM19_9HYME
MNITFPCFLSSDPWIDGLDLDSHVPHCQTKESGSLFPLLSRERNVNHGKAVPTDPSEFLKLTNISAAK